jgi:hypothetical protein
MTDFKFPVCVAADGTVTHPEKLPYDPYRLPWVTGAEDTLPGATRRRYPAGRADLAEKLSVLKSKRARNGADPRTTAWKVGSYGSNIDGDRKPIITMRPVQR